MFITLVDGFFMSLYRHEINIQASPKVLAYTLPRIASRSEADLAGDAREANKFKTHLSTRLDRVVRCRQCVRFFNAINIMHLQDPPGSMSATSSMATPSKISSPFP